MSDFSHDIKKFAQDINQITDSSIKSFFLIASHGWFTYVSNERISTERNENKNYKTDLSSILHWKILRTI